MTQAIDILKGIGAEIDAKKEMARRRMGSDQAFDPQDLAVRLEKNGGRYVAILKGEDVRALGLTPGTAFANLGLFMEQKGILKQ